MFSFWKKNTSTNTRESDKQNGSHKKVLKPFPNIKECTPAWKDNDTWKVPIRNPKIEIECREMQETIFDLIKTIKDPEKPSTLEELNVITEDSVMVQPLPNAEEGYHVRIDFNPTVPHCSLASLIGLCIRTKIRRNFGEKIKLDIVIAEGTHSTEEEINKQINDKERVAAALENPSLHEMVETCITENE